jgi:hypothetical protein
MRYIKQKLKIVLPLLVMLLALGGQAIVPVDAFACGDAAGSSTARVINAATPDTTDCSGSGVSNVIHAAVTVLSILIGAAAIIMILLSGFRYITSGGDSNKISGAKNALIYALVGVAIAALAQFLVNFVLFQSNNAINPPKPPAKSAPKAAP